MNNNPSNVDNEEMNPPDTLDRFQIFFKDYHYQVYTNQDKGYDYLGDGCFCITVKSPSGQELFIDLEEEFTITYDAWHAHYAPYQEDYECMLRDLADILHNTSCLLIIYSKDEWIGSILTDTPPESKSDVKKEIASFLSSMDFKNRIKQQGAKAHVIYWEGRRNKTITLEPVEYE